MGVRIARSIRVKKERRFTREPRWHSVLFTLDRSPDCSGSVLLYGLLSNPNALISIAFKALIQFSPQADNSGRMGSGSLCTKLVQRLIHRLCGHLGGFDLLGETQPLLLQFVDLLATVRLCLQGLLQGGFLIILIQGGVGEPGFKL